MRTEAITSAQNPKIRTLLELQEKSKARRKEGLFVVEGQRELLHCIEAGYEPYTIFICRDILTDKGLDKILGAIEENFTGMACPIVEIPLQLYDKVAYRGGTEGVIAEMHCRNTGLEDLELKDNPLVVVLESVEKPGNLGAVLRSADASGVDAVIVCDPLTDLYNPNLIRSSIGAIFTVPVATASSDKTIEWLKANGIKIYTAQLQDSVPPEVKKISPGRTFVNWARRKRLFCRIPRASAPIVWIAPGFPNCSKATVPISLIACGKGGEEAA